MRRSSVAPLTLQDCHVEGWKNPEGAVLLSRPPVLLFDCVFTKPPQDGQQAGLPPVRVPSEGQRLLVSGNQVHGAPGLTQGARPMLMNIPPGERTGVIRSASQSFLSEQARLPRRVFDARRDFGAQGDGVADDTAAIQKTIDAAAAASGDAIAYLPTGNYVITSTLRITGKNFFVGGSGWCTKLIWRGPEGGVMVEVRDPQQVTLEDLMIGAHDAGAMNNGIDIHQLGSANASHMTYDGVYVFGMYQKAPLRKGLRFTDLGEKDVVVMPHVQGNLRFVNCGRATVLANCSYEGSVVVEGKDKARDGLLGFQTRLATIVTHGLYLRDNHSIVMSDFYVEQADNGYLFEGAADDPPGRATLTGAKFHSFTSNDPAKNNAARYPQLPRTDCDRPLPVLSGAETDAHEATRRRACGPPGVGLELVRRQARPATRPGRQTVGRRQRVLRHGARGRAGHGASVLSGGPNRDAALTQLSRALDDLRRSGRDRPAAQPSRGVEMSPTFKPSRVLKCVAVLVFVAWGDSCLVATAGEVTGDDSGRGTDLVRLSGRSLCDQTGPFLGLGASYFQALRHAKYDRARLNSNLTLLAAHGFNSRHHLALPRQHGGLGDGPLRPRHPDGRGRLAARARLLPRRPFAGRTARQQQRADWAWLLRRVGE